MIAIENSRRCGRPRGACGALFVSPFADNGNVNASNFPNVGGNYNNGTNCGPFYANFNNNASDTNAVRPSITLHPCKWEHLGFGEKSAQPQLLLKKHGRNQSTQASSSRFGTLGRPGAGRRGDAKPYEGAMR